MMVRRAFIHTYCCQFGVLQHRSLSQAETFLHHCHGPYLLKLKLLNILRLAFLYVQLGLDLGRDIGCVNPNCCHFGVLQHQPLISR